MATIIFLFMVGCLIGYQISPFEPYKERAERVAEIAAAIRKYDNTNKWPFCNICGPNHRHNNLKVNQKI